MIYSNVRYPQLLASLFSAPFIENILKAKHGPYLKGILNQTDFSALVGKKQTIEGILSKVFDFLNQCHRCEYVFKTAVLNEILIKRHELSESAYLTEFRSYSSKADVVILNGTSSVYEIKSDIDTFDRLSTQLISYQKIFDRVYVVSNKKNCERLSLSIPKHVGILNLNRDLSLSTVREARSNIATLDKSVMFDSLRKTEYLSIIAELTGAVPKYPGTVMHSECKKIFNELSNVEAHNFFLKALKKRKFIEAQNDLVGSTPIAIKGMVSERRYSAGDCEIISKELSKRLS